MAVHKTKKVMRKYDELNIIPVFNSTYMPDYMPIETIFSGVKLRYKQQRLNKIVNGKSFSDDVLIRQVFGQVTEENILKAIN